MASPTPPGGRPCSLSNDSTLTCRRMAAGSISGSADTGMPGALASRPHPAVNAAVMMMADVARGRMNIATLYEIQTRPRGARTAVVEAGSRIAYAGAAADSRRTGDRQPAAGHGPARRGESGYRRDCAARRVGVSVCVADDRVSQTAWSRHHAAGSAGTPDRLRRPGQGGEGLVAVGRLDVATAGLLLLTTDTQLAEYLTNPKNALVRRYVVTARGEVTGEACR